MITFANKLLKELQEVFVNEDVYISGEYNPTLTNYKYYIKVFISDETKNKTLFFPQANKHKAKDIPKIINQIKEAGWKMK